VSRPPPVRRRPDLSVERTLGLRVCGLDEVGRGPLAGPVVAAAVVLPDLCDPHGGLPPEVATRLDDSKAVPRALREELAEALHRHARVSVALADVAEIEALNILAASMLAMRRAFDGLPEPPDAAVVDGNRLPDGLPCPARAVVKGDATCLTIAAASIVAKVRRDRMMAELAAAHPGYGWERNAGYPTAEHLAALRRLGPSPHHRRTYAPVEQLALSL
jgi:ribonuclease HII